MGVQIAFSLHLNSLFFYSTVSPTVSHLIIAQNLAQSLLDSISK